MLLSHGAWQLSIAMIYWMGRQRLDIENVLYDRRMSLEAVCEQMGRTPPWAKGLILNADGYECEFYKKD